MQSFAVLFEHFTRHVTVPVESKSYRSINLNTTKAKLDDDNNYMNTIARTVKRYIDDSSIGSNANWALFTYKDHKDALNHIIGAPLIDHFGNIVGKNDYRESKDIVQVGINRLPDWVYFRYLLENYPEEMEQFEDLGDLWDKTVQEDLDTDKLTTAISEQCRLLDEFECTHKAELDDIMCHSLFAECEQMIFRGIIRNADCTEDYTYHIFINTELYEGLISLMMDRYLPLGATIEVLDTSVLAELYQIMTRKGAHGVKTQPQMLVEWHDKLLGKGETFTKNDLYSAAKCTDWTKFKNKYKAWLVPLLDADKVPNSKGYKKKENWWY